LEVGRFARLFGRRGKGESEGKNDGDLHRDGLDLNLIRGAGQSLTKNRGRKPEDDFKFATFGVKDSG
jgi:hypothetical protein